MRVSFGMLLVVALLGALPVQASAAFKYTHRVTITGEISDNWTVTDPASCGANGSGSLKLTFSTTSSTRIRPLISATGNRPRVNRSGVWVLAVPGGGGHTHMGWRNAKGTFTAVDGTTQGPNTEDPGQPCYPPDKSGCTTKSVSKIKTVASGWDRSHLYAGLSFPGSTFPFLTTCRTAGLDSWVFPHAVAGGVNVYSDLLLKMPSAKTFKRKRVVVVTGGDNKSSTSKRSENGTETFTDDVQRKMVVTFTKI